MSITATARQVCTYALRELGAYGQGETPTDADLADAFQALQELVDNWTLQDLTSLLQERTVYTGILANQQDYTIGPSALTPNLSTGTAPRPQEIAAAALLLNSATPPVEIPIALYTDQAWQQVGIKTMTNPLFTGIYYSPEDPLGLITLWPVPTVGTNDLVLYTPLLVANFTTLSASYVCAPGYAKAFRFNLAEALLSLFATPPETEARIRREASQTLKDLKARNVTMSDLELDPAYTAGNGSAYNIWTDTGA